jgi:hypothetical protein
VRAGTYPPPWYFGWAKGWEELDPERVEVEVEEEEAVAAELLPAVEVLDPDAPPPDDEPDARLY